MRIWLGIAAILLLLAVVSGAFGAHLLEGKLTPRAFDVYRTAHLYHFWHALGILVVAALDERFLTTKQCSLVCVFLMLGILLFSGSLYALALSGVTILGAITPFGGLSWILAWGMLAAFLFSRR